jgi:hypothetical protein
MYIVPIVVALIGGPLMWLLHKLDRNNTQQHNENLESLHRLEGKVDVIGENLNEHINWHLDNENSDS